jgi:hypothetical protein
VSDNITLPRAVALQIREALMVATTPIPADRHTVKAALDALDAALAEQEKERAEVAAPARNGVASSMEEIDILTPESYPEHVTDGSPCWCNPELNYRDPETGAELWIHRREQ